MPKTQIQMTAAERRQAQRARRSLRELHDAIVARAVDAFLARHPEWAGAAPAEGAERNRAIDTHCKEFFASPPVSESDLDICCAALACPSDAQREEVADMDPAEAALHVVYSDMWDLIVSRWSAPGAPAPSAGPVKAKPRAPANGRKPVPAGT